MQLWSFQSSCSKDALITSQADDANNLLSDLTERIGTTEHKNSYESKWILLKKKVSLTTSKWEIRFPNGYFMLLVNDVQLFLVVQKNKIVS